MNIDAQNNTGATAIVIAAKDGHADIVYALLERGADATIEANEVSVCQPQRLPSLLCIIQCTWFFRWHDCLSLLCSRDITVAAPIL